MSIELKIPDAVHTSVDACHAALLYGIAVSLKPKMILEIGVGTGYCTQVLLNAIEYNGDGILTCVDSLLDQNGVRPRFLKYATYFEQVEEAKFVEDCLSGKYPPARSNFDLIVSDADHRHSHEWAIKTMGLLDPGGIAFFHDTANPDYPNLSLIHDKLTIEGYKFRIFTESSRGDERCERGWLMAFAR